MDCAGIYAVETIDLRCWILQDSQLVARLAQWIEHRFPKAVVAGSIPAAGAFSFSFNDDYIRWSKTFDQLRWKCIAKPSFCEWCNECQWKLARLMWIN